MPGPWNEGRALRLFAWGLLALWTFLGLDHPIGDGDESMHAEMLRQMLRTGDYLHTRWYGVVLHERPPLMYWLAVPFARVCESEVCVRLSSALMSYATLVLVYRLSCRLWGRPGAALTGTILLAAAPSFHVFTRTFMNESPYLLALTLALWGATTALEDKRGLLVAAAGLGAATALKSLAALVPLVALAPWLAWALHTRGDRRYALWSIAIYCAIALPFFALSYSADPDQFVREHIGFHLVARARGGTLGMGGGLLAYVLSIPQRDGPWMSAALATGIAWGLYRGREREQRAVLLLSSYGLLFFVGMSLIGTRMPHYILPLYPAAMLALSGGLAQLSARWPRLQSRLSQGAMQALAFAALLASLRYSGGRDALFERPFGKILGAKARGLAPTERLFAYEWYGLSLGYYADHPVVLLTAQRKRFESINFPEGAIAKAGAAALVPPLPAAEGSSILIAGHAEELSRATWFKVDNILAAAPPFFLARATVQSAPPLAALPEMRDR